MNVCSRENEIETRVAEKNGKNRDADAEIEQWWLCDAEKTQTDTETDIRNVIVRMKKTKI